MSGAETAAIVLGVLLGICLIVLVIYVFRGRLQRWFRGKSQTDASLSNQKSVTSISDSSDGSGNADGASNAGAQMPRHDLLPNADSRGSNASGPGLMPSDDLSASHASGSKGSDGSDDSYGLNELFESKGSPTDRLPSLSVEMRDPYNHQDMSERKNGEYIQVYGKDYTSAKSADMDSPGSPEFVIARKSEIPKETEVIRVEVPGPTKIVYKEPGWLAMAAPLAGALGLYAGVQAERSRNGVPSNYREYQ